MTGPDSYLRVRVSGTARERGRQYGEQAGKQIARSRSGYEAAFAAKGIDWLRATELAERHAAATQAAFPDIWEEIEGIAEGSGLPASDIFTMNCRTEILWSAVTASADSVAPQNLAPLRGECSAFAIAADHTETGTTLIGQNWDWLVHSFDSIVVLEVSRDEGPDYVTVVEGGLLAKTTLNAAGIALCVNTLVSSLDGVSSGIPFHVLLRALADIEHVFEAVELLARHERASSGNYLLAGSDGAILDIEVEPGRSEGVHPIGQRRGVLTHTNHFVSRLAHGHDLAVLAMPDSYVRLARLRQHLSADQGALSFADLASALVDHTDDPGGICCHPDPRSSPSTQWSTVMSVIIDVASGVLHLSEGNPCSVERVAFDYGDFFGRARPVAQDGEKPTF